MPTLQYWLQSLASLAHFSTMVPPHVAMSSLLLTLQNNRLAPRKGRVYDDFSGVLVEL